MADVVESAKSAVSKEIAWVKEYRARVGCSLREAKDAFDSGKAMPFSQAGAGGGVVDEALIRNLVGLAILDGENLGRWAKHREPAETNALREVSQNGRTAQVLAALAPSPSAGALEDVMRDVLAGGTGMTITRVDPASFAPPAAPVSAPSPAGGVREALAAFDNLLRYGARANCDQALRVADGTMFRFDDRSAFFLSDIDRDCIRAALSSPATPEPVSAPAGEVVTWKSLFETAHGALICLADAQADALYAKKIADELTAASLTATEASYDWYAACGAEEQRRLAVESDLSEAMQIVAHYADTFCELGPSDECCGKLNDDQCSGCRARAALSNAPGHGEAEL
jgi:hypothetical protein